jgi:hypothetical protein
MTITDHVREVIERAAAGDDFAIKTLACLLFFAGVKPNPDDGGGCELIDLLEVKLKRAA